MTYHFNPLLNTDVIDSPDGKSNWWYYAYYSGGWRENNVFHMDHYPWKEGTTFVVYTTSEDFISDIYEYYREETFRYEENNGAVIILEVRIIKTEETMVFNDITVTPHNLRNDLFHEDVITAIDVIMTLGDLGVISYTLQWYDEISSVDIVRNYFINSIDDDVSFGTCGFVYETVAERFGFDNHIHIPSDT